MEFFNITKFGFRDTFKPHLLNGYKEPSFRDKPVDTTVDGDCDGFGYGSYNKLSRNREKGFYKPIGPTEMYKRPITRAMEYGFWKDDPALQSKDWYAKTKNFSRFHTPKARFYQYALSINKYYHD